MILLNRSARLSPDYHDMSSADRAVVDSFERQASYNDTMARHLIPTTATLMQFTAHNPA